jgi:putative transcriptional regulator
MKAVFVESTEFTEWVSEYLPDETYARLQHELMDNPRKGTVIRGCGGLRKVRVADSIRGQGKRGGARVIYLYVPEARWFFMLDIYGKHERVDLSADEKKVLAKLAGEFEREAKAAVSRHSRSKP